MPLVEPLSYEQASEAVRGTYDRIKETIGKGEVPAVFQPMGHVESFLQDNYMNYRKFIAEGAGKLDARKRWAVALGVAAALNAGELVRHLAGECEAAGWTKVNVTEVLAVVSICSMFNTYYKFRDLAGDDVFKSFPAGLRAHTFQRTGLGHDTVELIDTAVSVINGCHACTGGHVRKSLSLGVTAEQIDEAIKVAATTVALATFSRLS